MKPTEEKIQSKASDLPVYLFKQGNNCEAYRYFGAHMEMRAGEAGAVFRVWAPHAVAISVVGDFNSWKPGSHPMRKVDGDSVWELFIPGMKEYDVYKYCVTTRAGDLVYKADPYAFHAETRPDSPRSRQMDALQFPSAPHGCISFLYSIAQCGPQTDGNYKSLPPSRQDAS